MPVRFGLLVLFRGHVAQFSLTLFGAIFVITVATLTAQAWRNNHGTTASGIAATQPTPAASPNSYVRRALLPPPLRDAIKILGDRLEKPGKERLILAGTLKRAATPPITPTQVRLILEIPGRLRLEEQVNAQIRITIFDGKKLGITGGQADQNDLDLVESLVFDTADHFFVGQLQGLATRFLGARFRLDDGQATGYRGPFYDLYQISDQIPIDQQTREQQKTFYFDSDTALLGQVRYQIIRNGLPIQVTMQFSDWHSANGQQIPGTITRLEGGEAKLTLTITSVVIGPQTADGIFTIP